jgi:Flp pilus assembly pilin Flp
MARVVAAVERLIHHEDGQDLVEYGMLAALIVLVVIAALTPVANTITNVFWAPIAQNF